MGFLLLGVCLFSLLSGQMTGEFMRITSETYTITKPEDIIGKRVCSVSCNGSNTSPGSPVDPIRRV